MNFDRLSNSLKLAFHRIDQKFLSLRISNSSPLSLTAKRAPLALTSNRAPLIGLNGIPTLPIEKAYYRIPVTGGTTLLVTAESLASSETRGAALFKVRLRDKHSLPVDIRGWRSKSEKAGQYFYLKPPIGSKTVTTRIAIPIPLEAVELELIGTAWKRKVQTSLLGDLIFNISGATNMTQETGTGSPVTYSSADLYMVREIPSSAAEIELKFTHTATKMDSSAPVMIKFFDQDGNALLPTADLPQSPKLGPYMTLAGPVGEESTSEYILDIPKHARSIELEGVQWGPKTAEITAPVEVSFPSLDATSVVDFIKRIPHDAPLLIIDTTAPPLGHSTLSLRPNNLTLAYERLGAWIIFVPFGTVQDQNHQQSEHVYQINRADFDVMLSAAVDKRDPENSYFICSSFPSLQSVTAVNYLKTVGWNTVYECRDDMEEFNRVGYSKWYSTSLERAMVLTADQTISVSTALDAKLCALAPGVRKHSVVPNAVNRKVIDNAEDLRTPEAMEARQSSKTIGYVGHLTDSWFDWPLIEEAAARLPQITFEIIGHGAPENLNLPANVKLLGPKTHDELPEIVKSWKVALIPFKDLPLTRSVDPNKIYEYFAWGMRCISAPMGLVHEYPSTWVYTTVDEFVSSVEESINTPITADELQVIESFVQTASWDDRAQEMFSKLGVTIKAEQGDL